ncbi:MAG: SDR family NAD(P)-dependent oxidoreductase [Ramlibacter sp.]|nr:SDR family NAD(P)-dependent oxidoreductase [Ramlibacter sp.]
MNSRPLARRVALVTGAGPGLGRALVRGLAEAGAKIVVCDVNETSLAAARVAVEEAGSECLTVPCDVSDSGAVQRMFAQAAERFGTVHILVNNAALTPNRKDDDDRRNRHYTYLTTPVPRQSLEFTSNITDEEWHRWWGVNVHGVFYCTREALKLMQPQKYGRIINIASLSGMSGLSCHSPHYSATKGAVIAFTKSVAAEVAGSNIYANVMAPGLVHTQEVDALLQKMGEEGRNRFMQLVPSGRMGTPEEYAATVVHLAGEHYMAGQVISPNGGMLI